MLLPNLSSTGEFMVSSTQNLSQFFKKKEVLPDANPYSVSNIILPEEPPIKVFTNKNAYKV